MPLASEAERKIFLDLVEQAAQTMGDSGCDDLDLGKFMPPDQWRALVEEMHKKNGDPENFDPRKSIVPNWWVLSHLAKKAIE